jgi:cell division protein FtsN
MLFGLSVGLIVAIGVYLRAPAAARTAAPTAAAAAPAPQRTAPTAPAQPAAPKKEPPAAESRFSFYEILPQLEVEVREEATAPARPATRPRPAEPPGSFLLQAGSFSASADADRLQANLALLGLESHVQRVTIEDDVFHRVRIGPIGDVDAAKRTQRRLRDAGIDALLMRVPN